MFKFLIAAYYVAVFIYIFKNDGSASWGWVLYYSFTTTLMVLSLFFANFIKEKSFLDKSLICTIVSTNLFNLLAFTFWYYTGHDEQNQPYIFCIVFAITLVLTIVLTKKRIIWK